MSKLFSPLTIGGMRIENRVQVSPMCQYSAHDVVTNDCHLQHLMGLALSGAGWLMFEATHVAPEGRITHGCAGLWSDASEAALKRIVDACRSVAACKLGVQLAHGGRKGSAQRPWEGRSALAAGEGAWQTVAPSALALAAGWHTPTALDAVAGSKVSTKLTVLESLLAKVDKLIVGGGIANTFLAATGVNVGKSLQEAEMNDIARKLLEQAKARGAEIPLPTDVVVAKEFAATAHADVRSVHEVRGNERPADRGALLPRLYAHLLHDLFDEEIELLGVRRRIGPEQRCVERIALRDEANALTRDCRVRLQLLGSRGRPSENSPSQNADPMASQVITSLATSGTSGSPLRRRH